MQGDWTRARADCEAVLRLNPTHTYAALLLGAALIQTGEYERAVATLSQALTRGCKDPGAAYYLMGQVYQKTGKKDLAQEALRRARELGYAGSQMEGRSTDGKKQ